MISKAAPHLRAGAIQGCQNSQHLHQNLVPGRIKGEHQTIDPCQTPRFFDHIDTQASHQTSWYTQASNIIKPSKTSMFSLRDVENNISKTHPMMFHTTVEHYISPVQRINKSTHWPMTLSFALRGSPLGEQVRPACRWLWPSPTAPTGGARHWSCVAETAHQTAHPPAQAKHNLGGTAEKRRDCLTASLRISVTSVIQT